jgi:hypothetical protein
MCYNLFNHFPNRWVRNFPIYFALTNIASVTILALLIVFLWGRFADTGTVGP